MITKLAIALATVLLANTCNSGKGLQETLLIKENKVPCTGVGPMECMQVRHEQDSTWTLFYDSIEGFDFEPGYTYKLRVAVTKVDNPPADASALRYKLVKVLEKTPATTATPAPVPDGDRTNPWRFIAARRWALIQLNGKTLTAPSDMWIEFDPNNMKIHGNGGCNLLSGAYESSDTTITFQQVVSTRKACIEQEANERESAFLRLLDSHTYRFDVADQTLNLYDSGKIILMFGMQEKPVDPTRQ
ncbi:DUF4377 domain-containing protein [Chitinophaga pendula]|uniref:DUF4377 domain-containing protein n=1 Tax=Chitinophaga TaxID=79328 RepID=UPI000BAF594C|nr:MULTISPECIES: DUF4377 domain-containing protein [Chitinophaga]ASZ10461.1 hypothetical protein CK934_05460 [Chitinophaga sp. MD30]UCJ06568.1 DUF4377 domain-containing protein [Chitinophaga pendula]